MNGLPQDPNAAAFTFASSQQPNPSRPPPNQIPPNVAVGQKPPQIPANVPNPAALKTANIARNQPVITARIQTGPASSVSGAPVTPKINIYVSNSPAPDSDRSESSVSLANSAGVTSNTPMSAQIAPTVTSSANLSAVGAPIRGIVDPAQLQKVTQTLNRFAVTLS